MVLSLEKFSSEFFALTKAWDWEVQGFLDSKGYVHPIDTDTKVISTVFERLASPAIRSIANAHEYTVELANQTTYPDFTLSRVVGGELKRRIALDIKTTYLSSRMVLTLGGYNSFLRVPTKSILHAYHTYDEHWILGFVYKQRKQFAPYDLNSMPKPGDIPCPYSDVQVFTRHKYELCGLRAGSGNTKNIGSYIATNPEHFKNAKGPFCSFSRGKDAADHYWRNYERLSASISAESQLLQHSEFAKFK